MEIKLLYENGYNEALLGIGLSHGLTSTVDSIDKLPVEKYRKLTDISRKLAFKKGGENKFLRQITVCIDLNIPWYMWKEFDTYKVGTTAQSESTMHTITKSILSLDDFETENLNEDDALALSYVIGDINHRIFKYHDCKCDKVKEEIFYAIISMLPSCFLQRRIVTLNYAVLQNMLEFRSKHKLHEWRKFCTFMLSNVAHPELLVKDYE